MISRYEVFTESQIKIMPEHMIKHKFNRMEDMGMINQRSEGGIIPFEGFKSLVDGLNQLLNILLSQGELAIRSLKIETSRQRTLNGGEVVLSSIIVTLGSEEDALDYFTSAGGLLSTIGEAGFKVKCRDARIELVVSFPPLSETSDAKDRKSAS